MDIDQSQKTFQLNVILEFLAKMMDEFGMKKSLPLQSTVANWNFDQLDLVI